jgi:radical SAM superfamily enzyme YgiQ (UPF0313 family)
MDVLLIDPPYKALKGIGSACGYSINLVTLAAYLREAGIDTAVLTGNLLVDLPLQETLTFNVKEYAKGQVAYEKTVNDNTNIMWKKISENIMIHNPQIVGITCVTPAKDLVDKIASLIKSIDKNTVIIAGGHHPTFCEAETLENPNIDFVIKGEGEIPLLELVKAVKSQSSNIRNIPSIAFKENGDIVSNPDGTLIQNLDRLPLPARDLVIDCDYKKYNSHYVSTARGCPYSCIFCSDRKLWKRTVRRRSIKNVIDEIMHLNENYDVNSFDIVDGTFTYHPAYLKEFCLTLIEKGINTKWRCTARYNNINEKMLKLLKKANCSGLYFGLESGSERILKSINKELTVERIIEASGLVNKSGIKSITSVLLGLPNETQDDIECTLRLIKQIKTDIIDINSYVPLPGTRLYDNMDLEERKKIDWRKVGFKSYNNHFTKHISNSSLTAYIREAHDIAEDIQKRFHTNGGWR